MTEEQIQDARTEWLLLWGYRKISEVWRANGDALLVWNANIITDHKNGTYQLKKLTE